jgi:citrate lyase subunit beta/citryl-CoA lyase
VPGDDPRKIAKALASGADEVVVDIEDAVAASCKEAARDLVRELAVDGHRVAVRINAVRTPWCHLDLAAAAASAATSVVLPKTESRADIGFVERLLDGLGSPLRVQALVETARGVAEVADIVDDRDRLDSIVVGYADLSADLGRPSGSDWRWVQEALLIRGRAAGIEVVDGPYLGVHPDADFVAAAEGAAALGFAAKWVIHPRQVDLVNRIFTPTAVEVAHAREVLGVLGAAQAAGTGAVSLGGRLVDEAMAVAARRVLAKASS